MPASINNRTLLMLERADFAALKPHLEPVDLRLRQKIDLPGRPITHVYFVEHGIVSVVAIGPNRLPIEVGVVGFEGFTGLPAVLGGDRSPLDTYVQVAGSANRIEVAALTGAMERSPSLTAALNRYVQAFLVQVSQTALANGRARLEERLARWLLMAQDRLQSDELSLTHEFLALMLAVRRPGVTVALSLLQDQGFVKVKRGKIVILQREALLEIADKFYGVAEAETDRLLGSAR